MRFSRRLAMLAGILLPAVETARRWHQLGDIRLFWAWFDDYAVAAFLLYAAWRMGKDAVHGHRVLAAAWGVACALAFQQFFCSAEQARTARSVRPCFGVGGGDQGGSGGPGGCCPGGNAQAEGSLRKQADVD